MTTNAKILFGSKLRTPLPRHLVIPFLKKGFTLLLFTTLFLFFVPPHKKSAASMFELTVPTLRYSLSDLVDQKNYIPMAPNRTTFSVKRGESLSSVLQRANFTYDEQTKILDLLKKHVDLKKIQIGQNITVMYAPSTVKSTSLTNPTKTTQLDAYAKAYAETSTLDNTEFSSQPTIAPLEVRLKLDPYEEITIHRDPPWEFILTKKQIPLEKVIYEMDFEIDGSLFYTFQSKNMPISMANTLYNAFSYDVDFQRDLRSGNQLRVIFEVYKKLDGSLSHFGEPLFASLETNEETFEIYAYNPEEGSANPPTSFYHHNGVSAEKGFLKTPIVGLQRRLTSAFGMRKHPILGYTRMHAGIDFGAPRGTPVLAAASGRVIFVGRKSSYGKTVKIEHHNGVVTLYAHLSAFANHIKPGTKIDQGTVIGRVGQTGRATGPHLHYEIAQNNQRINPLTFYSPPAKKLTAEQMDAFKDHQEALQQSAEAIDELSNF